MRRLASRIFLALFLLTATGGCAVAADVELQWEWPADRSPKHRVAATVTALGPTKQGVAKSPSIARQLPDPMLLEGKVTAGHDPWSGHSFKLVVPKVELADIAVGDTVALGVVDDAVCICIAPIPREYLDAQLQKWLADWKCTP